MVGSELFVRVGRKGRQLEGVREMLSVVVEGRENGGLDDGLSE